MTRRWDELTALDFPKAVEAAASVCVVPIGCMERHGDHLPVATDVFIAGKVAEEAAKLEYAVVFPPHYFGQINEGKGWPGAVALRPEVLFALLENVCEEIGRNGLTKVVILNSHGGNSTFLDYFVATRLNQPRPYTLYLIRLGDYWSYTMQQPEWKAMMESEFDYHGGEAESSLVMVTRPGLAKMKRVGAAGLPQGRLGDLGGMCRTASQWYADFPGYYAGDAATASREKGRFLLAAMARRVADILKLIKADEVAPALESDLNDRAQQPRN